MNSYNYSHQINRQKCPICGQPNQCAQEVAKDTGKPQELCWCVSVNFSSEILDRVPVEAKNKACICETCVKASAE